MDGQRQSAGRSRPMMKGREKEEVKSSQWRKTAFDDGIVPRLQTIALDTTVQSRSDLRSPYRDDSGELVHGSSDPTTSHLALVREEEKGKKWLADYLASQPANQRAVIGLCSTPHLTLLFAPWRGIVPPYPLLLLLAIRNATLTTGRPPNQIRPAALRAALTLDALLSALCNLKPRVSGRCSTPTQTGLAQTGKGGFPVSFCAACALTHTPSIGSKQLFSQSTSSHDRLFRAGVGTCSSTATD